MSGSRLPPTALRYGAPVLYWPIALVPVLAIVPALLFLRALPCSRPDKAPSRGAVLSGLVPKPHAKEAGSQGGPHACRAIGDLHVSMRTPPQR
jgi:hypothetical protein